MILASIMVGVIKQRSPDQGNKYSEGRPARNTDSLLRDDSPMSSPRSVRNGDTPPSSTAREGKRKPNRRKSRDGRTQGSITAADISEARKLANEEDDR